MHLSQLEFSPGAIFRLGGKGTKNNIIAAPVVYQNKLYIGVGQDPEHDTGIGHLWCINLIRATNPGPGNHNRDVSPVNNNFNRKAKVNLRSALHWHFGGRVKKGEKNWTQRAYHFGRTISTCAIKDGLLYAVDFAGFVFCMEGETGKVQWFHDAEAATWSSPFLVDINVFLVNEDGLIRVFQHGKKKKLIREIDTWADKVRAPMASANGRLYLMTEYPTKLWAIQKK